MKILKIHENSSFFKIISRVSTGSRIGLKTIYNTQTSHLQVSEFIPARTRPIYNFWNFDFFDFIKFTLVRKLSFVSVRTHPGKNSSHIYFLKFWLFCDFCEIHMRYKSFHLWVNCRNFDPKIRSLKSLERIDVFCTMNRKFSTITTKFASFSSLGIFKSCFSSVFSLL